MLTLNWTLFVDEVWPIWGPMLLGSLPWGIVAWFATYITLVRVSALYKARTAARRAAKNKKHGRTGAAARISKKLSRHREQASP